MYVFMYVLYVCIYIYMYRYMKYSRKMLGFSMAFPPLKGGRSQVRAKLVLVTLRNQAGALGQAAAGRSGGKPDFLMGEQLVPLF